MGQVLDYRFDYEASYKEELQKMEGQFVKKYRKDVMKINVEK